MSDDRNQDPLSAESLDVLDALLAKTQETVRRIRVQRSLAPTDARLIRATCRELGLLLRRR
jgi:hypothetical protein